MTTDNVKARWSLWRNAHSSLHQTLCQCQVNQPYTYTWKPKWNKNNSAQVSFIIRRLLVIFNILWHYVYYTTWRQVCSTLAVYFTLLHFPKSDVQSHSLIYLTPEYHPVTSLPTLLQMAHYAPQDEGWRLTINKTHHTIIATMILKYLFDFVTNWNKSGITHTWSTAVLAVVVWIRYKLPLTPLTYIENNSMKIIAEK